MPITVLKNNVPWGPFTRAQIQDGLTRGDFTLQYLAHGPGLKEWLPLGEVLDHFDRGINLPPVPGARYITPMPAAHLPSVPMDSAGELPTEIAPSLLTPVKSSGPPPMPVSTAATPFSPKASVEPISAPSVPLPKYDAPKTTSAPLKPAAFFPRFIAFVIDCGVLFLPIIFVFALAALAIQIQGWVKHTDAEAMRQGWSLWQKNFENVLVLVASGGAWIYAAGLECSRWQATVGKQWMGMKVTDAQGERMSFLRSTGRHVAKFISALPIFLGFTMALFSPDRLALHDRIASTRVLKK